MKVITSLKEMQSFSIRTHEEGKMIVFVPTMGALHEGHIFLLKKGRAMGEVLVMSIFINPTQFNNKDDLKNYPRTFDEDCRIALEAGTDIVFAPTDKDMYPEGAQTFVDVTEVSKDLCGASRPGHFRGVTTIVAKLFNIVQPDIAIFGEKDYQQLAVIRQMVKDLNMPIEIIGSPTVREPSGLAMSSRNARLSPEGRKKGAVLHDALVAARSEASRGTKDLKKILDAAQRVLRKEPAVRLDYLKILDATSLKEVKEFKKPVVVAVAAFVDSVRLIDNIVISPD